MKSLLNLTFFVSLLALPVLPVRLDAQSVSGWDLVWSDEFDQADGSKPDAAKWGYDTGGGGWGNGEIQYYTDRAENARIEGGQLLIEAREESYGGRSHTSARLLTKGKWDWTYGRFEARIKVPRGTGLWPAFWMLGADIDSSPWPDCGEIDIMEYVGREAGEVFGTIHGPGYSGADSVGGTYTFGTDISDDYHVFMVEWDEELIRWFVDGINYFNATPASLGANNWVFDHDHFLLLNLAIDGNFAGPLDPALSFPRQLWVDYVRVYTRSTVPGTGQSENPGFETGTLDPWIGYAAGGANEAGGYVESTSDTYYNGGNPGGSNVQTHSGRYAAKVFGGFTGGENYNGFYQDIPAVSGSLWTADGWALTHPQDLMVGENSAWLEVSFRNAADTVLSLYRSPVLTSANVTAGAWMNLAVTEKLNPQTGAFIDSVVTMQAPSGATSVRFQVVFRQKNYDGGSIYFDDLNLVEHFPAVTMNASIEGGEIHISFPTRNGVSYRMAYKSSLTNETWTAVETIVGNGTTNSVSYPANAPARFYGVIVP